MKVVLITGAAQRIGACIAKTLHTSGFNIVIHYQSSRQAAESLCQELNNSRDNSAAIMRGALGKKDDCEQLAQDAINCWGQLDALVNNASSFFPTAIGTASEEDWTDLFNSNAKGPFFLSQALAGELKKQSGAIVNIVDIHSESPLGEHTVYCMAKSALNMMTRSLARELAPVRVNGVSPGAILWPENDMSEETKQAILEKIPLGGHRSSAGYCRNGKIPHFF